MKRQFLFAAFVAAALFVSCGKDEENTDTPQDDSQPTQREKAMIPEQMTWKLDSVLVIYDYQTPNENSVMRYSGDGISFITHTFYPYTYRFPDDMFFIFQMGGDTIWLAESYSEDYCKYVTKYQGEVIAAGNLCYYRDMFTFSGIQVDGMIEFMVREASTNWNNEVWTCAYNASEEQDGTVLERHIEYYSRVE